MELKWKEPGVEWEAAPLHPIPKENEPGFAL